MNLRNFTLLLLLSITFTSEASQSKQQTYKGLYFYNFENAVLTPKGSAERWCVKGDMSSAELPATNSTGPWGTADVVVQGELGPVGRFGNLGSCSRVLSVSKVLKVRNKKGRQ